MSLKKAGIGIDPYKLDAFKEALTKEGYKFEVGRLSEHVQMIYFYFEEKDFEKIKKLIQRTNMTAKVNKDKN